MTFKSTSITAKVNGEDGDDSIITVNFDLLDASLVTVASTSVSVNLSNGLTPTQMKNQVASS